jgi:hypothetical protein
MVKVREFREEDQDAMTALEPMCMRMRGEDVNGTAYTVLDDERVICVCGVQILWEGVGEAWAMVDAHFGKVVRALAQVRVIADYFMARHGLWRMQSHMMADWDPGKKFVEKLGFKREHTEPLRKWFPDGSDCLIYARVL